MPTIPAKTIVASVKSAEAWFGARFNMNIYRGCCHGCIYCDSRSDCYQVGDFDTVRAKENALALIERELAHKRIHGAVGTGAMSDPYNPFEHDACLTRGALELLDRYRFGITISTKSDLVARDIDLLRRIQGHSLVCVNLTITTVDDALAGVIEPHAPRPTRRLEALRALSEAGIYVGVLLMPILPGITDTPEQIAALVEAVGRTGARFVFASMGMTLRSGNREYFYEALDRHFPGLKERYQRSYGERYECSAPNHRALWRVFADACQANHLAVAMPEIIAGAQGAITQQQPRPSQPRLL
ncbi:MAG: SPL family radical SAM protein [Anaerolineae bacterium]